MRKIVKILLTVALVLFQLGTDVSMLFAAAIFVFELLGDNDDGTFTPNTRRTMIAAMWFVCVLAVWLFWLYATVRALIGMWGKKAGTAPKRRIEDETAP